MRPSLIIRADAGSRMGSGHLMRCLALAEEWQSVGGKVEFISDCESKELRKRILEISSRLTTLNHVHPHPADWEQTTPLVASDRDAWVALDGYHFDSSYQARIKEAGCRLLVIDDTAHLEHYYADLLVNPNIQSAELSYQCEPHTRQMLGSRFALIRSEFYPWQGRRRGTRAVARRVLITMGGSDPHNQSLKALRALQHLDMDGLEAVVVIGPSNPYLPSLQAGAKQCRFPVRLVQNADHMAELMAWADVGIASASSTCWEFAFMGLPGVILVTAENQEGVARSLEEGTLAINLGWYHKVSEHTVSEALQKLMVDRIRRKVMSEEGRRAVNGTGVREIVAAMVERAPLQSGSMSSRPARIEDARCLWEWANDPTVRANSFNSKNISWNEHRVWYQAKMSSQHTRLWILELDQVPVAQIRYDRVDTHTAEIALSVATHFRRQGIATKALTMTMNTACKELGVQFIRGYVLNSNEASIRTFIKAGFICTLQKRIRRKPSSIFQWEFSQRPGRVRERLH